ncbi:MAG TPA: radical SAM protein [Patescibacteria group bacterium]
MKAKKVLLYNSINKPFMEVSADPMNLGTMAISAVLKEHGYEVVLIPNIDFKGSEKKLKKELKDAVLVGVSCMTGDPILNGLRFSQMVKKYRKDIPVCWGGYHATIDYENTIKNKNIDFIVRGQGERTIVELMEALKTKKFNNINGLVYKKRGKMLVNQPREIEPIDNFPFFDYEVYMKCYKVKMPETVIYCSSRGCPFECTFCSVSNFYKRKYLMYSKDRFLEDIALIAKKYNPKMIFFWDDNFFVDMQRVDAFLDEYIEKGYKFEWWAFSRCGTFAKENKVLLERLKKCNCKRLLFGAESGSEKILEYIKKHIKVEDILDSCKVVTKYGIDPDYTFISGFPTETVDDLKETVSVIDNLSRINKRSGVRMFSFCPTPGIPILADCKKNGFKSPESMEEWANYEYHSFVAPWVSKKHQKLIKKLVWITTFLSPQSMPGSDRWWLNSIFKILHYDAVFRMRTKFFAMGWEWEALYNVYRHHYVMS